MRPLLLLALSGTIVVGCDGGQDTDTDVPDAPTGPELAWTDQPSDTLVQGEPLSLTVSATDEDGVATVTAYYKTTSERTWNSLPMTEGEAGWTAEVPAEGVVAPGIDVYFKGDDALGQTSFLPPEGLRAPITTSVRRVGVALPYEQGFEDVPNDLLREIGWSETSLAFEGYEWATTVGRAFDGESSVVHRRTPSTVSQDIEDWLISPPLDLTTLPRAQVSWMEYGDTADQADHALWISTGSPDPRDGDYELLGALSRPPEGEWGRSDTVDLTPYADAPAAYLAWVYKGRQADIWWVDDVSVRALAPDLRVADLAWTPDPLSPGDTGTLSLTLDNRTPVDAAEIEVLVATDDGVTFDSVSPVASLPGNDSVVVDVPLTVAGDAVDNSWGDLDITLTTEADTWSFQERMLIGQPSTLGLAYDLAALDETDPAQLVRVTLGVGDPEAPLVEEPLLSELQSSGSYEYDIDVTEYANLLPPLPGDQRWWVRFENGPSGDVTAFEITWGGESYVSDDLGAFFDFAPDVFFLPRPPDPVVSRQSSTPNPIGPGDSVSWTLDLVNRGRATVGETSITVSTDDPGVTLTDAGPKLLSGTEGWSSGSLLSQTFAFDVDATRKSSRPVRMIASIEDDYETFTVPVDVQVPYPVISVTGVVIDDFSDGDDDGLLDPDESATLELDITNIGGLGTFGATTCTLAQTGGAATVTVPTSSVFAGIISAGSSKDEDFDITVTSGAVGDDIQLELTCTDREETYVSPVEIVLGERPWIRLTPLDDAIGDNKDGYRFDIVNGRYRSDGTNLQVQLDSAGDYGGLTGLFIDSWAQSAGGDYTYYHFAVNGSSGNIRGYVGRSFTPLGSFTVTAIDADTVQLDIPLEPLGLALDSMNIGFAAGFCGGADQYCDHHPNGWGDPYSDFFPSRWTTVRW